MQALNIDRAELPASSERLRQEVRSFLRDALAGYAPLERARNWNGFSREFSLALGQRGWIGMTWPKAYGGGEYTTLDRYVVSEELLSAGAPVAAHWGADRQVGPLLLRYSPDVLAPRILPRIAAGDCYMCIGMSEPDTGSDLASVRTRAVFQGDRWVVNGRKVWTTLAHRAHYMVTLVRTSEATDGRHSGLSQLLIDMRSPGVTVRPILNFLGDHEFNEVTLDDVEVAADHLIGKEGCGWEQVTSELTLERSGPERFLSSTQLVLEMLARANPQEPRQAGELGRIVARYSALRQMSLGVAGMYSAGRDPALAAAIVKDQGSNLEQSIPEVARKLFAEGLDPESELAQVMNYLVQATPSYSLRGGTREILRGIIARGLGLR